MEQEIIRGRFAPSPSGRMHLGNAFSALLAWLDARSRGGEMVLRIEDLDPQRTNADWTGLVADDLAWLGLDWDEGYGKGGEHGPYCQSERTELYREAFERLKEKGTVYPCWCSRAERLAASAPHVGEVRDPGVCPCRDLAKEVWAQMEGQPAWKAAVPREEVCFSDGNLGEQRFHLARDCGDFILRRRDGVFAYQLAVTLDDALMGVNRVVRGRDLLTSTPWQIWLHEQLGFRPPEYCHVPLLLAPDGRRLAKRDRDLDLGALRQRCSPETVIGVLAWTAGLTDGPEKVSARELVGHFSWEKVGKTDRVFDAAGYFNGG